MSKSSVSPRKDGNAAKREPRTTAKPPVKVVNAAVKLYRAGEVELGKSTVAFLALGEFIATNNQYSQRDLATAMTEKGAPVSQAFLSHCARVHLAYVVPMTVHAQAATPDEPVGFDGARNLLAELPTRAGSTPLTKLAAHAAHATEHGYASVLDSWDSLTSAAPRATGASGRSIIPCQATTKERFDAMAREDGAPDGDAFLQVLMDAFGRMKALEAASASAAKAGRSGRGKTASA